MTWNFGVVKMGAEFAVHEVLHAEHGRIHGFTAQPVNTRAEGVAPLRDELP